MHILLLAVSELSDLFIKGIWAIVLVLYYHNIYVYIFGKIARDTL